jgi:cytochrome c biogenesis protein CcdA
VFGEIRIGDYSLPIFTIFLGLIDGFNPCALWVLLFILSLLVHLNSRRKMLLIAGTFVLVSGAVYFAFMAAWLNFFLLVGAARWVQIALAVVALSAGGVHIKDYFAYGQGPTLSIPDQAKSWIGRQTRRILQVDNLPAMLVAVSVLAFLVNAVELLCTAGLPAIYTQVLSTHALPAWKHYAYLLLYDVAYMLDDSIMVFAAVLTFNPRRLGERGGRRLKLVSGVVMIGLATLLLFKPEWLSWTL